MANAEVLIIGCGIAGATAALRLARNPERQITIITRASDVHESNTRYAQGGIIGRGPDDTSELLYEDIVAAGAGVTSPKAARILADEGPQLLNEVLEHTAGVVFDHNEEGAPVWDRRPLTRDAEFFTSVMPPDARSSTASCPRWAIIQTSGLSQTLPQST